MVGFVGAGLGDLHVFGLVGGEAGEVAVEGLDVHEGDFFVELFGQTVDAEFVRLGVELDLSQDLVRKGVGHNK